MNSVAGVLNFPVSSPASSTNPQAKSRVDHRNTEEAALVRRVQARDEILRNHNDAEDIAQQVFSKIYFSIKNFDFRSSLLTWIYKITVNECYDYLRKKRVRKLVYESDFSEEDAQRMQNTDAAIDQAPAADTRLAQRDLIGKLMGKLSSEDRSLLLLKEVEGHSVEELSQMTGMNENTIKVLLKAAQRLNRGTGQTVA